MSFKGGGRRTYTDKPCVLCLLAGMLLFSSAFVVLGFVAAQVPHGAPRPDPPAPPPPLTSPPPPPRTKWTHRVPPPVLIGHAASLTPY